MEGRQPDEALLAFLRLDELLVDIGDDLTDYEDDVEANSFNIYRGERSTASGGRRHECDGGLVGIGGHVGGSRPVGGGRTVGGGW